MSDREASPEPKESAQFQPPKSTTPSGSQVANPGKSDRSSRSLKRTRETSAEPQTPKNLDHELTRESAAPQKKNRGEGETSPPRPSSSASSEGNAEPVNGSTEAVEGKKINSIRKRIDDLSWQEEESDLADEDDVEKHHEMESIEVEKGSGEPAGDDDDEAEDTVLNLVTSDPSDEGQDIIAEEGTASSTRHAPTPDDPSAKPIDIPGAIVTDVSPTQSHESGSDASDVDSGKRSRKRKTISRETSALPDGDARTSTPHKRPREDDTLKEEMNEDALEPESSSHRSGTSHRRSSSARPHRSNSRSTPSSPPKPSGFAAYMTGPSPLAALANASSVFDQPRPQSPPASRPGFAAYAHMPAFRPKTPEAKNPFTTPLPASPPKSPGFPTYTSSQGFRPSSPRPSQPTSPLQKSFSSPGFASYSSIPSPFLTSNLAGPSKPVSRGSTPKPGAGFGSYTTNAFAGFGSVAAASSTNGEKEDSEGGGDTAKEGKLNGRGNSFGDILAAKGNQDEDENEEDSRTSAIPEVEIVTGEEDETTLHSAKVKLFAMVDSSWKERGVGTMKLNVRTADRGGSRLIMRSDAVLKVLLNTRLFANMKCNIRDQKYFDITALEQNVPVPYLIKTGNALAAEEFVKQIKKHIPL